MAYDTWAAGAWGDEWRQSEWLGAIQLAAYAAFQACPGRGVRAWLG